MVPCGTDMLPPGISKIRLHEPAFADQLTFVVCSRLPTVADRRQSRAGDGFAAVAVSGGAIPQGLPRASSGRWLPNTGDSQE